MRLKKSEFMNGWYGFYTKDENRIDEEIISVKSLDRAKKIIDRLQKDYEILSTLPKAKEHNYG